MNNDNNTPQGQDSQDTNRVDITQTNPTQPNQTQVGPTQSDQTQTDQTQPDQTQTELSEEDIDQMTQATQVDYIEEADDEEDGTVLTTSSMPANVQSFSPVGNNVQVLQSQSYTVNPPTVNAQGQRNYRKRKISLVPLINDFQRNYTITCLKRTAPYGYGLPFTFMRILLGINSLCKGSSKTESVLLSVVQGALANPTFGGLKDSLSLVENICKMTADPFPLLESAADKNKGLLPGQEQFIPRPLYNQATGNCLSPRYSMVGLSYLGEIAVGRYYDLYKSDIKSIKQIKTLVPISLLRKKTTPWALGHKTVNYSYNLSELFQLQAKMLEYMIDKKAEEPWLALSDADVAEIFKGPDFGEHYTTYMTNDAGMSLYHLGLGSVTVIPDIVINTEEHTITFLVPPLGKTSKDLVFHLNRRWIGACKKKRKSKRAKNPKRYPKFQTFDFPNVVKGTDISVTIYDVTFHGTVEEVINELCSDPFIRVTTPCNNTILLNAEECEGAAELTAEQKAVKAKMDRLAEEVQDVAYDNFVVDTMPIHELLWRHVVDEFEIRFQDIKNQIKELEARLEVDKFLEKVTRPDVATYISSQNTRANAMRLREVLYEKLGAKSPNLDKNLLPEGFEGWELDEIVKESAGGGRTGLNILRIMFMRSKYENMWKDTLDELDRLKTIQDNPNQIYAEIHRDLVKHAQNPLFARKTKAFFLEEIQETVDDKELEFKFKFNNSVWDGLNLPCSIFYNGRYLAKSYGRNINLIYNNKEEKDMVFTNSLNCTNEDLFYVFQQDSYTLYTVSSVPSSIVDMESIRGIVPYSADKAIMVLLESRVLDETTGVVSNGCPRYFIIPPGGLTSEIHLGQYEIVKSWAYMDKKYIEMFGFSSDDESLQLYGRFPTEEIPYSPTPFNLPYQLHFITDINATDNETKSVPLLSSVFNGTVVPETSIFSAWPIEGEMDTNAIMHPLLTDTVFTEIFSPHIEFYAKKLYMHDWHKADIVVRDHFPTVKKSVVSETTWCRPDDAISIKLDTLFSEKVDVFRSNLNLIISASTDAYSKYTVAELTDWSIINPRYKLPLTKPTNQEYIDFYVKYLEAMNTCNVSSKDYKAFKKEMAEIRACIIEESDNTNFIDEVNVFVPDMSDTVSEYTEYRDEEEEGTDGE